MTDDRETEVLKAMTRILDHAKLNGEVYDGAAADIQLVYSVLVERTATRDDSESHDED